LWVTWKESERVLETPRGLAGEEGADLVGLKPGGAFHISCSILGFQLKWEREKKENCRERDRERERERDERRSQREWGNHEI